MKYKMDIFLSFTLYGLGLLAFLLVDLYIVKTFSNVNISEWAFLKSLILIVGSFCLLGYDQIFIRDDSLINRFFIRFNINSALIIFATGLFLIFVKAYSVWQSILILFPVYLFAFISYIASAYRAYFRLFKAQFSTNLWRIFLLVSVVMVSFEDVKLYFIVSLFISSLVIFFTGGLQLLVNKVQDKLLGDSEAKKLGFSFVLMNITLILAVYGEQFLININNNINVSSHLFTYFSIFTPIALSMNGFIGFYYGPKVRKDNNMTLDKYKRFFTRILLYSFIVTAISIVVGFFYMKFFMNQSFSELDHLLIVSLAVLCIVRGSYISTSVCLGVFGNVELIKRSAVGMCIATLIYIGLVFIFLHITNPLYTAFYISLASVINWILRLLISNYYSIKNLKLKSVDVTP